MSIFFHYGNLKRFIKQCPVTFILIIVNTAMFIATMVYSLMHGAGIRNLLDIHSLVDLGGLVPYFITEQGEYYRLFTSMFLHASTLHFLFNTFFGILIISGGLERLIGSVKFLILYLGSGLISSLTVWFTTVYFTPDLSSQFSVTIGASGAIFGTMGVFLYIIIKEKNMLSLQDQNYIKMLLVMNIFFTLFGANISIPGHLGGLAGGFLFGMLIVRSKGYEYS